MIKGFVSACMVVFLGMASIVYAQPAFDVNWHTEDVDISVYQEMYFLSLDLRDIKVEVFDDEDHIYYKEDIESEELEKLANDLYERFNHRMKDVIPLNPAQMVDETNKSLTLNVKLSGLFRVNDQGWLMKKVFKDNQETFDLKINGVVTDSQSGQEILTFESVRQFNQDSGEIPLTDAQDMDGVWDAFDFWARQLASLLADKKIQSR